MFKSLNQGRPLGSSDSVPEQLFSTPENPVEGISTVKALKMANDQGIPIYTINQQNISSVLPQLQVDQQVKADIQNAVNAGKVVTVSKSNVSLKGWTGCGYIITDPETGAGAYMISGGTNGGFMYIFWTVMWVLAWVTLITAVTVFVVVGAAVLAAAMPAIIAGVTGVLTSISELFLTASILTYLFLEASPILNRILVSFLYFNEISPPSGSMLPGNAFEYLSFFVILRNNLMQHFWSRIAHLRDIMIRLAEYPFAWSRLHGT